MQQLIFDKVKRRQSCLVCHRQSQRLEGLKDFTCFSCGNSYDHEGKYDGSHFVSKKKLYLEFQDKGVTLSDSEADFCFKYCHSMANRKDFKIRPTFQKLLMSLIDEYIKRGWKGKFRSKKTGLVTKDGKQIAKDTSAQH